jgi:hypothetical protein
MNLQEIASYKTPMARTEKLDNITDIPRRQT